MNNLTIRFATAADDLDRLAQLDSSLVPAAPRLVAEAVTLLRGRARQLAPARARATRRPALRTAH